MKNKMNKKAMSISIVLLVILTLILCIMTIAYFVINEKGTSGTLNVPSELDAVYSDANSFNFYFNSVFQKVAGEYKTSDGPVVFIARLNDELNKTLFYPSGSSYIEYSHLSESSVEIINSEIALNLDVFLTNNKNSVSDGFGISYGYSKRFFRKLH
jgi:hypothetical protein